MKRIIRTMALTSVILIALSLLISCQNVFGNKTESEFVYGNWIYEKKDGSAIKLDLNEDGTYYYAEVANSGKVLYEHDGDFGLTSNRLLLRGLDTGSEDETLRYNVFGISMKNSTSEEDILDLVPKMTAKYSFKRVGEPKRQEASLPVMDIQGKWVNDEFATITIVGNTIEIATVVDNFVAEYQVVEDGKLALEFDREGFDLYNNVEYFVRNNSLYLIFPSIGSETIVFTSSNQ